MNSRMLGTISALALTAFAAWPARAAVPTVADYAACNMKAAESVASDAASASPRAGVPPRAGQLPPDARPSGEPKADVERRPAPEGKAGAAPVLRDPTGATISSDKDPQVEGMAADRANDPVYVAAYRGCMRQRGF